MSVFSSNIATVINTQCHGCSCRKIAKIFDFFYICRQKHLWKQNTKPNLKLHEELMDVESMSNEHRSKLVKHQERLGAMINDENSIVTLSRKFMMISLWHQTNKWLLVSNSLPKLHWTFLSWNLNRENGVARKGID